MRPRTSAAPDRAARTVASARRSAVVAGPATSARPTAVVARLATSARRVVVAAALATTALAATTAGPASAATSCPDADAPPAAVGTARSAAALGCLLNHERQAAGLAPLTVEARTSQAAQWHVDDMAARGYFAHDAPAPAPHGTNVGDRLSGTGYVWTLAGENIARGQDTPRSVMTAWLASAGHCSNIMRPGFTDVGFGITTAGNGPYWGQVFARPMGVAAPAGPAVTCPRAPASPAPTGDPAPVPTPTVPASGDGTSTGDGTSAGGGDGSASDAPGGSSAADAGPRPTVVAVRRRRQLTVRVTVLVTTGRSRIVVRVRQGGRVVGSRTVRRGAGTHRLVVALPGARAGRVTVRVGARSTAVRFR